MISVCVLLSSRIIVLRVCGGSVHVREAANRCDPGVGVGAAGPGALVDLAVEADILASHPGDGPGTGGGLAGSCRIRRVCLRTNGPRDTTSSTLIMIKVNNQHEWIANNNGQLTLLSVQQVEPTGRSVP